MGIEPVKPGGWSTEDLLTSEQVTQLQDRAVAHAAIFDRQMLKAWLPLLFESTPPGGSFGMVRDPTRPEILGLFSHGGTDGSGRVYASGLVETTTDIPTSCHAMALDPDAEIVVAGTTSAAFTYRSLNFGNSWIAATTAPSATVSQLVWGDGVFLAMDTSNGIHTSPDGDVWTTRSVSHAVRSIAMSREAGGTERLFAASQNLVSVSSDSGATWSAAAALPDASLHAAEDGDGAIGSVRVGAEILPVFLANISDTTAFRVYRGNADGSAWTLIATLPKPEPFLPSHDAEDMEVRILGDLETGALLAVVNDGGQTRGWVYLSMDGGLTWPSYIGVRSASDFLATAGRVFMRVTRGAVSGVFMSAFDSSP